MEEPRDDTPISQLESLRAPPRSDLDRREAMERILQAATPLLNRRSRPGSSWDVLASWARPGLVAASIALAMVAGAVQLRAPRAQPAPVALDEVLVGSGAVLAVLVANSEPDADAVVVAALFESTAPAMPADIDFDNEQR